MSRPMVGPAASAIMFSLAGVALTSVIAIHNRTISSLVDNHRAALAHDAQTSKYLAELHRRVDELEKRQAVEDCRHDLIAAATRSGWADAYRMLREGALEDCEVE